MINGIISHYQIEYLLHFTKADNIKSISKDGLQTRALLDLLGGFEYCDEYRLDGRRDGISLSVSFPNYRMFYKYRKEKKGTWCVIVLKPLIAENGNCLFFSDNAASSKWNRVEDSYLKSRDAFHDMFKEILDKPTRKERKLLANLPTDPQSEIIHIGPISREMILGIAFETDADNKAWEPNCSGIKSKVVNVLFKPRIDYAHWR